MTLRLKRRVGAQRVKENLWAARWYKARNAVAIGLAIKSVPLATLRDEAIAYARTMTDNSRATLATLKQIIRDGHLHSTAEGAAKELAAFAHYNRTEPYGREGYTALREKRLPSWKVA